MGTAAVGILVLAVVGLVIRSMVKSKKAGKSISCGGDCRHCHRGCH